MQPWLDVQEHGYVRFIPSRIEIDAIVASNLEQPRARLKCAQHRVCGTGAACTTLRGSLLFNFIRSHGIILLTDLNTLICVK